MRNSPPQVLHERPIEVGDVVQLTVASLQPIGAFLDWGKEKDLFLPFSEQTRELQEGDQVIVRVYVDNNQRSCASMKVEKFLEKHPGELQVGDSVKLLILSRTDLGFKAAINSSHLGMLYHNEIFRPIRVGLDLDGFIQRIREDGKIDLCLQQPGHRGAEEIGQRILDLLETRGGFLAVSDNSSPEVISDLFGVSKKKFKMALGGLYKKKLITLDDKGIGLSKA
jgi:uncharacterized protein